MSPGLTFSLVALLSSWPSSSPTEGKDSQSCSRFSCPQLGSVSECVGTHSSFGVSGGTTLCLRQVQNALNLLLAFVLPLDSITRCSVLIRTLPSGLPQLRFYVHLNMSRAMTHAAELFFFFFNATSCPEPRRKEKDICFLESRAGVKHPSYSLGAPVFQLQ